MKGEIEEGMKSEGFDDRRHAIESKERSRNQRESLCQKDAEAVVDPLDRPLSSFLLERGRQETARKEARRFVELDGRAGSD